MKYFVVFISLGMLLTLACEKQEENGFLHEDLDAFDTLELNSSFHVFLVDDTTCFVEAQGHERTLEHLEFKVSEGKLSVKRTNKTKWLTPEKNQVNLYVHAPRFSKIHLQASCEVKSLNTLTHEGALALVLRKKVNDVELEVDCDAVYCWNGFECGGQVRLSGHAREFVVSNHALMTVEASEMFTRRANVLNQSQGNVSVRVLDQLNYSIKGSGHIHVFGSPDLVIPGELTSSGRLIYR